MKTADKKERNSNFELLRIVSMMMIILWHIYHFGGIKDNPRIMNPVIALFFELLSFFLVVHVNSYVLVTGYFFDKTKVKLGKVCSLIDSMFFYRVVSIIVFVGLGLLYMTKVDYIDFKFLNDYWFVQVYIALYLITPFLNKLINHMKQKEHLTLLVINTIILSLVPFFTGNGLALNNSGYSLYGFVYLYFLAAYIKKYPIRNNFIFSHFSDNLYKIFWIIVFIACALLNFLIYVTLKQYSILGPVFKWISNNYNTVSLYYSNPFIILQSVAYFLIFEQMNFKSKIVNKISKLTLGIYFIHETNFVRLHLYKWLRINNGPVYSYKFIIYVFLMVFVIFIGCGIIEFIRQTIMNFIQKRKIVVKFNNKIGNFVKNIRLVDSNN